MSELQYNVLDEPLKQCGMNPKTGYFRDGSCRTDSTDVGSHTLCAVVTDEFLLYSKAQGNDLITPVPQYDFPGLKAGDRWCLCASRWKQAFLEGAAPKVVLQATHKNVLQILDLDDLLAFAVDLPNHS